MNGNHLLGSPLIKRWSNLSESNNFRNPIIKNSAKVELQFVGNKNRFGNKEIEIVRPGLN